MSLIDSHVEVLYTKQHSVMNRVDLQTGQGTSFFPAHAPNKAASLPVLRCHHSTLTRKKGTKKDTRTHGRPQHPSTPPANAYAPAACACTDTTLYSSQLRPCARPGACRLELSKSPQLAAAPDLELAVHPASTSRHYAPRASPVQQGLLTITTFVPARRLGHGRHRATASSLCPLSLACKSESQVQPWLLLLLLSSAAS